MTKTIKPISGMLTLREAQYSLKHLANKISDMDHVDVQDVNSFVIALNLRLESMESVISLLREYVKQIDHTQLSVRLK